MNDSNQTVFYGLTIIIIIIFSRIDTVDYRVHSKVLNCCLNMKRIRLPLIIVLCKR